MLKSNTLNASVTLASQLADKGLTIVAKPNTVLNELVGLAALPYDVLLDSDAALVEAFSNIEKITAGSLENPNQHGLQLDGVIKDLSRVVTAHVSYARTVVKPLVVEFAKDIEEYLTTYKSKTAGELFEVQVMALPELASDESFLDTLKPYQKKTVLRPDLKFRLGLKTKEELLGLITYGYDRTDKLVLDWASHQSEEFLTRIYNSFFTQESVPDIISYPDIDRLNVFERLDHALAILLMATKLFSNVDDSASDVDLQVYRNTAAQYRDYAGALVCDCLYKISTFIKTETLVIETSPDRYKVKVNGEVYRQWLQEGGTPEAILGLVVAGGTGSSKAAIDSKKAEYLTAWNSFCTFYGADQSNKSITAFKEFLLSRFAITLKELSDDEQAYILKTPKYYSIVNQLAQTYVDGLKKDDMKDVFGVALMMVAQFRFYYTSAFNILNDINEAARINPNVDVREAALLAVVNYLVDYLSAQTTLVNG